MNAVHPDAAPLRLAIVGCGRIARQHAAAIRACPNLTEIDTVVDSDVARARDLAQSFDTAFSDDFESLLRNSSIDALVLCTPNALHAEQAVRALAAGKHVLVEKPIDRKSTRLNSSH